MLRMKLEPSGSMRYTVDDVERKPLSLIDIGHCKLRPTLPSVFIREDLWIKEHKDVLDYMYEQLVNTIDLFEPDMRISINNKTMRPLFYHWVYVSSDNNKKKYRKF